MDVDDIVVPGEGPQPARGMIVGEAPGRKEVELGRPFVGRSGQLLDAALRELSVDRSSLYITNAVKRMPVDSDGKIRKPSPGEIALWLPLLLGEIEQTEPEAILGLGKTTQEALAFDDLPAQVFSAWHPSYVLRKGAEGNEVVYGDWLDQLESWAEAVR